ncbi:hypothetical protein [Streptomyces sp. enrichment culture]|uniref:hypothetical protein n=1 Tax=Streptomyces sp. enrichment culture TaxID=1795815 RepID=UPI003F57B7E3
MALPTTSPHDRVSTICLPAWSACSPLRVWHAMWVERIDRKIAAVEQRQAEEERARRLRPAPPGWVAAFGGGFEASRASST